MKVLKLLSILSDVATLFGVFAAGVAFATGDVFGAILCTFAAVMLLIFNNKTYRKFFYKSKEGRV